jgi:hypothetical protein
MIRHPFKITTTNRESKLWQVENSDTVDQNRVSNFISGKRGRGTKATENPMVVWTVQRTRTLKVHSVFGQKSGGVRVRVQCMHRIWRDESRPRLRWKRNRNWNPTGHRFASCGSPSAAACWQLPLLCFFSRAPPRTSLCLFCPPPLHAKSS